MKIKHQSSYIDTNVGIGQLHIQQLCCYCCTTNIDASFQKWSELLLFSIEIQKTTLRPSCK